MNPLKNIILLSFISLYSFSQHNQWIWISGDTTQQPPVWGTQGVASSSNFPGGRYAATFWTGKDGKFWLYGGQALRAGPTLHGGDLWRYDPSNDTWVWLHGVNTNSPAPIRGTKGVSSPANTPGYRMFGAASWTDNNGNLWLFGGNTTAGSYNDLWKYDIATNEWTWMHGSNLTAQAGIYGTRGVSNPANTPGSRAETSCTWVDANNNLWLFGGQGYDFNGNTGELNDLWRYNISTNEWTWVAGSRVRNQAPVYGTKGVAAAANRPGGRFIYSNWIDAQGDLWLLGGSSSGTSDKYNDLWKYDVAADMWTWMQGLGGINDVGVYNAKCDTSTNNIPKARFENRQEWTDDCGNFWMFGGEDATLRKLNDLWMYSVKYNKWLWISGAASGFQPDVFGAKGVPSSTNMPGGKVGGVSWQDSSGFWIYGGTMTNAKSLNVLWKYIPDKPTASFTFSSTSNCVPATVTFTNTSIPGCNEIKSYWWDFGDPSSGASNYSTDANPIHIYNSAGNYTVKLLVTNCTGSKDSITHIFTASTSVNTSGSFNICTGQSVSIHGVNQTLAGVYTQTYSTTAGCDSVSTITLTVGNPIITSASISACAGQSVFIHGVAQNTAGVYSHTATAAGGCDSISNITLQINSLSTATINPVTCNAYIHNGQSYSLSGIYTQTFTGANAQGCDSVLTINLTITPAINTNTIVSICTGQTTMIHGINQNIAGVYTYSTTTTGGCDSISNVTLLVISTPTLSVVPLVDTLYSGSSITIIATGAANYRWSNGSTQSSITVLPSQTKKYCVQGENSIQCKDSVCSEIIVINNNCDDVKIFIPTAFSPNGDGNNDELKIFTTGTVKSLHFAVYNRWGQVVFEANDITKTWDGVFNNQLLDAGVFNYTLQYDCKGEVSRKIISGNISLIR